MIATFSLGLFAAAFTLWQVDPFSHEKYVPTECPKSSVKTACVRSAAARGEIEAASFTLLPERDLADFDLVVTSLAGPDGATLPAEAVDLRVVKPWYRSTGRWFSSWRANQAVPELLSTILLHDDAVIRVDEEKKVNWLRIDYPAPVGPRYVDMSHDGRKTVFNYAMEPVHDAPKFVPIAKLRGGRYQQFWLTYRVPADQKPGTYRGRLAAKSGTGDVGAIELELEVYPFELPEARTHYDTAKPYQLAFYGSPSLGKNLQLTHDLAKAERRLENWCRNMAEHNVTSMLAGDPKSDSTDDLSVRNLVIMRRAGVRMRPVFAYDAYEGEYMDARKGIKHVLTPEEDDKLYVSSPERFRRTSAAALDLTERLFGHRDVYYFAADECAIFTHRRCFGYYDIVRELGARVYADYADPHFLNWALDVNCVPANCSHSVAWSWHRGGAEAMTYSAPFCGPECPDIWRRHKGLRFYLADYDGVCEYDFFDGKNRWKDMTYFNSPYCQFGLVHSSEDGIIDTPAWEGLREGYDDVRYYSLLRLRAQAAMKSEDAATRSLGRTAIVWFDSHDPERILDLDAFRGKVAKWILKLVDKVGPETSKLPGSKLPPALPPSTGGAETSAGEAPMKTVARHRAAFRDDLAIALCRKIRTDRTQDFTLRTEAALAESEMLSYAKRRTEAAAIVRELASEAEGAKRADRGRLLLAEVRARLSDVVYEERYTAEQLNEARKPLDAALHVSQMPTEERVTALCSFADACLHSGEYALTVELVTPYLKIEGMKVGWRRFLARIARAQMGLKEYDRAVRSFNRAINEPLTGPLDATLFELAAAGEAAKDWKVALDSWTRLLGIIDKVEDKSRYKQCENGVKRCTEKLRDLGKSGNTGFAEEDSASDPISLDE